MYASGFPFPNGICIRVYSPILAGPSNPTDSIYVAWGQDAETSFASGIFLKKDGADFDPSNH
jgi:hypothetical protein